MQAIDDLHHGLLLLPHKRDISDQGRPDVFLLKGDVTRSPLSIEERNGCKFPWNRHAGGNPFHLKIIHFNDLHGNISNYDGKEWQPVFSKFASYIKQVKSSVQNQPDAGVLVLSGGDDIIGSPFDVLLGSDPENYELHPGYHVYSKAGIDAAVLGNHDFDLGLEVLKKSILLEANFPVLSANLHAGAGLDEVYSLASIFIINDFKVAVIGLTTPAEPRSRPGSEYDLVDPIPLMKELVPVVREMCDMIIVLSHLGRSLKSTGAPTVFAGDIELAQALPFGSVDLIIGGHTHESINLEGLEDENIVNGIPITQAGHNGQFLGEIDLFIQENQIVKKAALKRIEDLNVDDDFERKFVLPLIQKAQPKLKRIIGIVEDSQDLRDRTEIGMTYGFESALHNFVTDNLVRGCYRHGYPVDLSLIDSSVVSAGLRPGEYFTYEDWMRVIPYANTVEIFKISGKDLYYLIADNARRIDLPSEAHEDRGFLYFSKEIRYNIKLNSARSRIQADTIQVNGEPIERLGEKTFWVATTNFFRVLARRWEERAKNEFPIYIFEPVHAEGLDTGLYIRELLLEQMQEYGGINKAGGAKTDGRIRIL